jgi:hypothetical protein
VKTRLLALLTLGLGLACSQSSVPPPTGLSGTNSSVVSGSLLFVTSTRSNELRVLDLEPRAGFSRDFVRAPNPLSPLSVPTLPSPVELSTPTRYGPLGQPLQGDWVFARGAGGSAVSVIGAVNCPQQLKEFGRISPRPDSVVTALTSRLTSDDRQAQLYFATFDGTDSTIWELLLPNLPRDRGTTIVPSGTCNLYPASLPLYVLQPLDVIPDEVVTAMVALPTVQHPAKPPDPEERGLVIATRLMASPPFPRENMAEQGRIRVVTPQPGGLVSSLDAVFNSDTTVAESFPVKRLVTHGNVVNLIPARLPDGGFSTVVIQDTDGGVDGGTADVVMDAGTRVFGILDEASCAGRIDCVGVLAVDLDRTTTLQTRFNEYGNADAGLIDDGGTQPVVLHPVAIDGFDDRRDVLDTNGNVILLDGGVPARFADTYWRPPNTFPDGGVRDANRMLPIRFANNGSVGVIQDIVIQSNGLALYYTGAQLQYGLLGFVTVSGYGNAIPAAQIFAFDAMTLRQINFAQAGVSITDNKPILNNGATATFRGGPQQIAIERGSWPYSESVGVLYEGVVAGIAREPLDAGLGDPQQGLWPLSINSRILVEQGYVEPGDVIVPVDYTGTECEFAFPVKATEDGGVLVAGSGGLNLQSSRYALAETLDGGLTELPDGGLTDGGGSVLVLVDGTVPIIANCPPPVTYTLRSSSLARHALTVSGTLSGFLGRVALPPPGSLSTFDAGPDSRPSFVRFWRPDADAGTSAATLNSTGLSFQMKDTIQYTDENNDTVTDAGIEPVLTEGDVPSLRGSGYVFTFANGYTPASVPISSATLQVGGLNLPGALSLYQRTLYPQVVGADRIFVLYPGGNAIVDFSPTTITFSVATAGDIGVHF